MSGGRPVHWIVPAYNEAASIVDLTDRIAEVSAQQGWEWDLLVVDDGSTDDTGPLLRAHVEQYGLPVSIVRNEPNQGLGFTIRRGLRMGSERSAPDDVLITLDADLTQDPGYAPSMVAELSGGYDVVIASRYRAGSGVQGLSGLRRALSYGASAMVALVRPVYNVRDYSCGFRAYRASVIQEGFAEYGDEFVSERGFACMLELAERLRENAAFVEVPFVLRYQDKRKASEIRILPTIGAYFRVIAKVASTRRKPVPYSTLGVAFASIALSAVAQLMLRLGAQDLGDLSLVATLSTALTRPIVLGGLAVYAVASALWLGVLSRMELAVAYPLGASGYVFVVLLAALSGEMVTALRWFGVLLIVLGVLLVGWLGVAPVRRAHPE
ncbi:MAG: glycosyltransferase [Coriobacteriia bacterium]|nr:glycosyltransferase [Coriobacteriia bacterium]